MTSKVSGLVDIYKITNASNLKQIIPMHKNVIYLPRPMNMPTNIMASRKSLISIGRGYRIERTSVPFKVAKPYEKNNRINILNHSFSEVK